MLKFSLEDASEKTLDWRNIVRVIRSLGDEGSFARRRDDTLSGSYKAKIVIASMRLLDMMVESHTPQRWQISKETNEQVQKVLKNLRVRYQKLEKSERAALREKKKANQLSQKEIKILSSKQVKPVLEKAANSLEQCYSLIFAREPLWLNTLI